MRAGPGPALDWAQGPRPRPLLITLLAGAEFKFWDSWAQNKTSKISKLALSEFLRLLCAEQHVGNFKTCTFGNSGTPVRRTRRRKSQKCTFKISGTPVRRTKRQTYQNMHFHNFWDSCAQNKTSELSKMHVHDSWNSCAQNNTPEVANGNVFT